MPGCCLYSVLLKVGGADSKVILSVSLHCLPLQTYSGLVLSLLLLSVGTLLDNADRSLL